jgi:hypothetical protein
MIKLSQRWAPTLLAQPETGMGYQVVSIVLKNGTRYDQVAIESGFITKIRGRSDIPFEDKDIAEIIVTHDKWRFETEK